MTQKRGQITVFIVVGIIVLFAVGFVIYISGLTKGVQLFGPQETEIQLFIGNCLASTAQDAIRLLGNTGGYMDIPENIALNERAYFSFAPNTEPKIPLWYYRGQWRIPSKDDFAKQISNYVVNNIGTCLGNLDFFKDRFFLKLTGNVTAETTISDQDVFVNLNYPLETQDKSTGEIAEVGPIGRTLSVKLGRMYNMAIEILQTETRNLFFENLTIDMMTMSADIPFTVLDFSCTPDTWRKSTIIDYTKNTMHFNLGRITMQGSDFTLYDTSDLFQQKHFVFKMDNTYSDIIAMFSYPVTSRFELHIRDNDREYIRCRQGRSQDSLLNYLCIQSCHFNYDVEYPILTTLRDENAFDGEGFIFNFAFPVTINHNLGDKTDFPLVMYENPDENYDFCTTTSDKFVDIRALNKLTREEIYNANINYMCVRYSCDLGATTSDGGVYRLNTQLPAACTNGQLTATADGYLQSNMVYDESGTAEILMKPVKTFNIRFIVRDSNDLKTEKTLIPGESVALYITGVTQPDFEKLYSTTSDTPEMELIEGDETYNIEAYLIEDDKRVTGGYISSWNATYGDMYGKNTFVVNIVRKIPIAITEDEQAQTLQYLFEDDLYKVFRPGFE